MNKTVVISCAGKGSRLGKNLPKCLINVCGKTVIQRQLELLKEVDEIIVVVGYKAEMVIEYVKSISDKIKFVYNNDYENTATGASFILGANNSSNEMIIALDGDLIVHPSDMQKVLALNEEFACGEMVSTENPVFMEIEDEKVTGFNRERGDLEWSGLAGFYKKNIIDKAWYVYNLVEPLMPLKVIKIKAREIDTPSDLKEAERWIKNNYDEQKDQKNIIDNFFKSRFDIKDNYVAVRYHSNNRIDYDMELLKKYVDKDTTLLDLGCGTGLIEERLSAKVKRILAVDKYGEFLKRAIIKENIEYIESDLTTFKTDAKFDTVILFGVTIYLDKIELERTLKNINEMMHEKSVLIIKNQWGLTEDIIVDKYSDELKQYYYANYRNINSIVEYLSSMNLEAEVVDIYPAELNKWKNTHEYALVCKKCK